MTERTSTILDTSDGIFATIYEQFANRITSHTLRFSNRGEREAYLASLA